VDGSIVVAIIGGLTALISVMGNIVQSILSKKYEKEKALKTSVLENAYKAYEHSYEIAMKESDKHGHTVKIYPWDMHVVSYVKILKLLDQKDVHIEDVKKLLNQLEDIQRVYDEHNENIKNKE